MYSFFLYLSSQFHPFFSFPVYSSRSKITPFPISPPHLSVSPRLSSSSSFLFSSLLFSLFPLFVPSFSTPFLIPSPLSTSLLSPGLSSYLLLSPCLSSSLLLSPRLSLYVLSPRLPSSLLSLHLFSLLVSPPLPLPISSLSTSLFIPSLSSSLISLLPLQNLTDEASHINKTEGRAESPHCEINSNKQDPKAILTVCPEAPGSRVRFESRLSSTR